MLKTRIITAIIGFPIVIYTVAYGGLPYKLLIAVAGAIGIYEMARMLFSEPSEKAPAFVSALLAILLLLALIFNVSEKNQAHIIVAAIAIAAVINMFLGKNVETAFKFLSRAILTIIYVPLLIWYLILLRDFDSTEPFQGWEAAVLLYVVTWGTDTGAYFMGKYLGKHKLAPNLSPKKTIEGLFGGVLSATILTVLFSFFFYPKLWFVHALFIGIVAAVWGQSGDLLESLLKRVSNVKDSGKIVPGHGGMLDRIDALIINAPLLYFWIKFIA